MVHAVCLHAELLVRNFLKSLKDLKSASTAEDRALLAARHRPIDYARASIARCSPSLDEELVRYTIGTKLARVLV